MHIAGKILVGLAIFLQATSAIALQATSAIALEEEKELAKASLNPLKINHFSEHLAAPFENDSNFGYGPNNNAQNILNFKPVIPFRVTPVCDLILRAIAPIYERTPTLTQHTSNNGSYINGWGDINPTFFISPAKFHIVNWGLGPTVFIPTATNSKYIGTGKWSIGPELVMMAILDNWMFGFLAYNVWSVAGDSTRPTVNQLSFQYLVSYIFDGGWYVSTNPSIIANWKKPANQQWLVPFGLGAGRTFNYGSQPINLAMHTYYNVIRPSDIGPNWQLQLEVEWLFPPGARYKVSFQ